MNLKQRIEDVEKWAIERGIFDQSNHKKQNQKSLEEVNEIEDAIVDMVDALGDVQVTFILQCHLRGWDFNEAIKDSEKILVFGNIKEIQKEIESQTKKIVEQNGYHHMVMALANMTYIADVLGVNLNQCLDHAYNEIKDRKGKMIDGMFVKDDHQANQRKLKNSSMSLDEFLELVGYDESDIKELEGEEAIEAVKDNGLALQFVIKQTPAICIEAIKENSLALQYVKDQTKEICIEAVKQNGFALQYVKDQTKEICIEAVKQNGFALQYVKDQTPAICIEAIKENSYALRYVKDQTKEICIEAVKENGYALRYVIKQTPEICLEAVKQNGYAMKYVKKATFKD